MVRLLSMSALILVNYVLQTTLLPELAILGAMPDTALIFIVSYGILRGDVEGAIFGLCAGLVQDIFGGTAIGLFALLGFLSGFMAGKPFRDFFKDNHFLPFFIVVGISLVYQFLLYFFTMLFAGQLDFFHYFYTFILPTVIYTASLSIPLYALMHVINAGLERYEHNRRKFFGEKGED